MPDTPKYAWKLTLCMANQSCELCGRVVRAMTECYQDKRPERIAHKSCVKRWEDERREHRNA